MLAFDSTDFNDDIADDNNNVVLDSFVSRFSLELDANPDDDDRFSDVAVDDDVVVDDHDLPFFSLSFVVAPNVAGLGLIVVSTKLAVVNFPRFFAISPNDGGGLLLDVVVGCFNGGDNVCSDGELLSEVVVDGNEDFNCTAVARSLLSAFDGVEPGDDPDC